MSDEPFVMGSIPGFKFTFISCIGNSGSGEVDVTFTYKHNLAQQTAYIYPTKAYAVNAKGNRYWDPQIEEE